MLRTELSYLLIILENFDENKPICVKDLKEMIRQSFYKAEKDIQQIEDSMTEQNML